MLALIVVVVNLMSQYNVFASDSGECYNRFEYELNVLENIVALKGKATEHSDEIKNLKEKLEVAEGTSYVRWGRTSCPDGAHIVYKGLAAGGHFSHSGAGTNRLCLPEEPVSDEIMDGKLVANRLYGAEYETNGNHFPHLDDHDVPCAVCRIPRGDIIMIPGRNICYDNYKLEYTGYLMSGLSNHAASSEFLCVDGALETARSGSANENGALFYFVAATCGPLPCPPYVEGRGLTCAVCSYNANINTKVSPSFK